jgi:tRNA A-37 threonylcarbamoyl transferase component Bud32
MTDYADDAGRYRLTERIATGGMGEVWRAEDTVLGRAVAVKLLKHEYADDPTFRSRFESEARHAGSLHHPSIASVFDYGEQGAGLRPRPYLVMELVQGQPLSQLLRGGNALDPDATRELLAKAADALGAAHAAGIVHRDVKPGNLMITPDRGLKMTDFGIARAAEAVALTATGQVMGTPQYLSPEQARGERAVPASDIYALGVVAFECLAGYRPFTGDSPVTTALAHLRDPVPELPDHVPHDLATVVRKALAKDPEDRYASAADFATALRDPGRAVAPGGLAAAALGAAALGAAATADDVATRTMGPSEEEQPPATSVMPAGDGPTGPLPPPAVPVDPDAGQQGEGQQGEGRGGRTLAWVGLAVAVLALGIVLWMLLSGGDPEEAAAPTEETSATAEESPEPTTSAPAEPTTSAAPSPTPTETTSTAPATVTVDEGALIGMDEKDAEKALKDAGLEVTTVEVDNDGTQQEKTVAGVSPTGEVAVGSTVTLEVWGKPPPGGASQSNDPGTSQGTSQGNGSNG